MSTEKKIPSDGPIITVYECIQSTSEQFDFDFTPGSARLTDTKFKLHCEFSNQILTVKCGTEKRGRTKYLASVFVMPEHAAIPEANRVIGFQVLEDHRTRADQDSAVRFSSNVSAKTIISARAISARSRREALRFVSNATVDTARKAHIPLIKNATKMLTDNVAKFVNRSLVTQGVTTDVNMDVELGDNFEKSDIYRSARNRNYNRKKLLKDKPSEEKTDSQDAIEKMNELAIVVNRVEEVD